MSAPIFHLLAGPNGAGKSTLYRALVSSGTIGRGLEFVNADLHERDHLQHIADPQQRSEASRQWADRRRAELLDARTGFVSETVFSHESKLSLISHAQALGFQVALYVVAVNDPVRLLARVSQRVAEGGHPVPPERILQRYPRTMTNLKTAVRVADISFIFDSVEAEHGAHRLVALCEREQTTLLADKLPSWVTAMLVQD